VHLVWQVQTMGKWMWPLRYSTLKAPRYCGCRWTVVEQSPGWRCPWWQLYISTFCGLGWLTAN
jgi:hypothetical protein